MSKVLVGSVKVVLGVVLVGPLLLGGVAAKREVRRGRALYVLLKVASASFISSLILLNSSIFNSHWEGLGP